MTAPALSVDYHATTPTASEVIEAMLPYFADESSNAHSAHSGGERAARAVARARAAIASLIGAAASEIVFTSGATEANNIAVLGTARAARAHRSARRRILTSSIEHKCVLESAGHLEALGFVHELVPVDAEGLLDLDALLRMIDDDVLLVSVLAASNEVGTIQPLKEISAIVAPSGASFHVDAAQAVGRIAFDVLDSGCDLASISAHKLYGPKGVGALYVSAAAPLRPLPIQFGGGQELGLRPGTLPVPLIVGFGRAAELAAARVVLDASHLHVLAARFLSKLQDLGLSPEVNGAREPRLPGSLNIRVEGADADDIIARVSDRLLLSSGSACMSGELHGSYVLRALGLSDKDVSSSFRLCFGYDHTLGDAEAAAIILAEAIASCQKATGGDIQQRG